MKPTALLLALAACLAAASADAASCRASRTWAPVIELYTSEGCSSCPPAEAWLGSLDGAAAAHRVVPLAFHVDYWNYIGWTDPFADPAHSARQRRLAQAEGGSVVYTPQVRLAGDDFRGWRSAGQVSTRIARHTPQKSVPVELALDTGGHRAEVRAVATLPPLTVGYLALYERHLVSNVSRGENAGHRLRHDFVVRKLAGPFSADRDARLALNHEFMLDAGWKRADLGVALIAADAGSGASLLGATIEGCAG
ncbi:MAG: DUF1223 domain-containing protein [Pseudomonadota bacterium]